MRARHVPTTARRLRDSLRPRYMHPRFSRAAYPAASRARTHARVLLATTSVAIAALTLAACFDRATAPSPSLAPVPRHDFLGDANWGANNSLASGSYDGTIDRVYGGAPAAAQALGPIVYPTFITANVSGQVRQVPGAVQGSNIVREAWSTNDPYFWGSMGFRSNGSVWWPIGPSAILRVVAPIAPFRNDAGGQPTGDWSHCGWAGYALCWTWAGTAHFDFQRIHVDLTLARNTDSVVAANTAVTFTAGMSQTSFPGNPYPVDMSALAWRWISSDPASTDTVSCNSSSGRTCTKVITSPGAMFATAYVNGEQQQKELHVSLPPLPAPTNKLLLNGNMNHVPAGGGSVTFSASPQRATEDWGVTGWLYVPDSGSAYSPANCPRQSTAKTCVDSITKTGTMRVYGYVPSIPNDSADFRIYVGDDGRLKVQGPTSFDPGAGPVTFAATASGAQSLGISSWVFHPSPIVMTNRIPVSSPGLPTGAVGATPPRVNARAMKAKSATHIGDDHTSGVTAIRHDRATAGLIMSPAHTQSLGQLTPADCGNAGTCTFLPGGPGYVIVSGSVDGEPQIDSLYTQPDFVRLKVTASSSLVSGNTPVTFVASGERDPAAITISGWRFVPDSGTLTAEGDCTYPAASVSCTATLNRSGQMWAIGTINGRTDSASAHVLVRDGAGTTCLATCADTTSPRLIVFCTHIGSSVVRGAAGKCSATVEPQQTFTLVAAHATADTFPTLVRVLNETYTAGQIHDWSGRFVVNTRVYFEAQVVVAGATRNLADSVTFLVMPRPWHDWSFPSPPTVTRHVYQTPHKNYRATPKECDPKCGYHLGYTWFPLPEPAAFRYDSITSGPDSGLVMVRDEIAFQPIQIYMHPSVYVNHPNPALSLPTSLPEYRDAAAWFGRQVGGPTPSDSKSSRYCTDSLIRSSLIPEAERHEGVTLAPNSHVGKTQEGFSTYHPQRRLESTVTTFFDGEYNKFGGVVDWVLHNKDSEWKQLQHQFEDPDYDIIDRTTCALRP